MSGYGVFYRRIDEVVVPGKRLGRHYRRDGRSAAYPFQARRAVPVVSREWPRHAPIFDQDLPKPLGSCTGNMAAGAAATSPIFEALPAGHPALNETEAVVLYSAATKLDGYPGNYPPTDTGSDGTAACQAGKLAGLFSGYTHAATLDDVLQALMAGPVGIGSYWYDSMDDPTSSGFVGISPGAQIRGGHEYVCRRVDADRRLVGPDNSWGPGWGAAGSFWLGFGDLERLLAEDGDCVVPLPATAPAPVPVPIPDPPPGLGNYLNDPRLVEWSLRRHGGDNKYAADQYRALRLGAAGDGVRIDSPF